MGSKQVNFFGKVFRQLAGDTTYNQVLPIGNVILMNGFQTDAFKRPHPFRHIISHSCLHELNTVSYNKTQDLAHVSSTTQKKKENTSSGPLIFWYLSRQRTKAINPLRLLGNVAGLLVCTHPRVNNWKRESNAAFYVVIHVVRGWVVRVPPTGVNDAALGAAAFSFLAFAAIKHGYNVGRVKSSWNIVFLEMLSKAFQQLTQSETDNIIKP